MSRSICFLTYSDWILIKNTEIDHFCTCKYIYVRSQTVSVVVYYEDVALKMLHDYSELAIARDTNEETALHLLARKPLALAIKFPHMPKSLAFDCKFPFLIKA